ncbi:MAG: LysR substrate-binding domain-containing protein [Candidatus Thiodiazotropha sp.]
MIEPNHLRIIAALQQHGTLTAAADALCLSQSALSHQIRYLEKKLGLAIWRKEGRRLRLTRAGHLLHQTADKILPILDQSERTLKAYADGKQGVLRIGVECYPCYEWLTGVVADYLGSDPDVDVDIFQRFSFSGIQGLRDFAIDLLVTPDPVEEPGLDYQPLFGYELELLVARSHPLADRAWVTPRQLAGETLITFPVEAPRLDILSGFMDPAGVRPRAHRQIESVDIMLQLTELQRGVAALPGWLSRRACERLALKSLHLGRQGMQRTLYAGYRDEEASSSYLQAFLRLARERSNGVRYSNIS